MSADHQLLPIATEYFTVVERLEAEIQDEGGLEDAITSADIDRKKMEILVNMREHLAFRSIAVSKCVKNPILGLSGALKSASQRRVIDWFFKMIQSIWETITSIQIWSSYISNIEGQFGSGVGSYFRFLRSLVKMNGIVFILL